MIRGSEFFNYLTYRKHIVPLYGRMARQAKAYRVWPAYVQTDGREGMAGFVWGISARATATNHVKQAIGLPDKEGQVRGHARKSHTIKSPSVRNRLPVCVYAICHTSTGETLGRVSHGD
jgi:hypothetical protein